MLFAALLAGMPAPADPACDVMQTAFALFRGVPGPAHPANLGPLDSEPSRLDTFVRGYRDFMKLEPGEFEDLAARQPPAPQRGFLPRCAWQGEAIAMPSWHDGPNPLIRFAPPIFATAGKLALVEVVRDGGFSATAGLCILRKGASGWTGRCIGAWSRR